jgi:hypothetical protein
MKVSLSLDGNVQRTSTAVTTNKDADSVIMLFYFVINVRINLNGLFHFSEKSYPLYCLK